MSESLLLAWERRHGADEHGEHLNDGYIATLSDKKIRNRYGFTGRSYSEMITRFSEKAAKYPGHDVLLMRLEPVPATIVPMHSTMAEMLRNDPVMYIRATSFEGTTLQRKNRAGNLSPKPLTSGVDILAQSVGDVVHLNVRMPGEGVFEGQCPECGDWAGFGMRADEGRYLLRCEKCHNLKASRTWLPVERLAPLSTETNPRYAAVLTKTLLARDKKRYFLPNLGAQWVTHEKLEGDYNKYTEEKESCTHKHNAP